MRHGWSISPRSARRWCRRQFSNRTSVSASHSPTIAAPCGSTARSRGPHSRFRRTAGRSTAPASISWTRTAIRWVPSACATSSRREEVPPSLKLKELAEQLQCDLDGDGEVEIERIAAIEKAGPGDLTFVANPKYVAQLATT